MDKYEKALENKSIELKECQKREGLNSCLPCPKMLDCPTRIGYVEAVYKSMRKDNVGGFDF